MTNPTKQDKILAIAKAMYGDKATVNALGKVVLPVEHGQHGVRAFNPYVSSVDSQDVQSFFELFTNYLETGSVYYTYVVIDNLQVCEAEHEDLKTAIADCAYSIVIGK